MSNNLKTCSLNDIKQLESKFSLQLPQDYKDFLLSNNGRVFVNNENIYINAIEDSINIDVLFGHKCDEENMNISSYMDLFEGDLMENTLIIGDTFNNGFIVLVCGGKDMGVYYWDHSYEYEISNDDGNMYFITKTFGEFLRFLL